MMTAQTSGDQERPPSGTRRITAAIPSASYAPRGPIATVSTTLHAGERLPGAPYVVMRAVGQGGMGEIYEAEHTELGRRAALKVLHPQHQGRVDLAARLRDEARLLGRLRHPNLVEVFDLGVTADGRPWFAMTMLRGRDLRDELTRAGRLTARAAAALMAQALDGLGAAHAAGVVHRDVKLENLFLEECGTVKVLDFGVAKVARAGSACRTEPGAAPGTPRTMSPEQCAGDPVDARADLYAVGLALYELTTGRGPFDDLRGNDHAMRFAHCRRRPVAPSALVPGLVPAALDAVIQRALAKSPVDRFQTAAEMAAALRRVLEPADRGARPRRSRRPLRGSVTPRTATTVSVLAMAVAIFALGLTFGRTAPYPAAPDRAAEAPR